MKGMRLYAQEKDTMAPPPGTLIRAQVHMPKPHERLSALGVAKFLVLTFSCLLVMFGGEESFRGCSCVFG